MTSALDITRAVNPPRAVFLNYPLGHQAGKPDDAQNQRAIVGDALHAFDTISEPGTIIELPYVWDPNDRLWEDTDYTPGFLPPRPKKEEADMAERERRRRYTTATSE